MKSLYAILLSIFLCSTTIVQAQSPGDVGTTDLTLWLRADRGITASSNGDLISLWEDQSPQGNHAVQTDPVAQPIYRVKRMNQSPALRFNQSQRFMNVPLEGIEDGIFTLFMVAQRAGTGQCQLLSTDNVNGDGFTLGHPDQNTLESEQFSSSISMAYPSFTTGEAPVIYSVVNNPATRMDLSVVKSGELLADNDTPTTGTDILDGILGRGRNGQGYRGWISEVILYDRVLTNVEIQQIQTYLSTKYSIWQADGENPNITDNVFNHGTFGAMVDNSSDIQMDRSEGEEPDAVVRMNNTTQLMDGEYVYIGHNDQPAVFNNSNIRCGVDFMLGRTWKVFSNRNLNNFAMRFSLADAGPVDLEDVYMIIDRNNNGFQDDQIVYGSVNGTNVSFTARTLSDGDTFTLAVGKTRWVAVVSGTSSGAVWRPINNNTAPAQVTDLCEFSSFEVASGVNLTIDTDMEKVYELTVDGSLDLNGMHLSIEQQLEMNGSFQSNGGTLRIDGGERPRFRGSASMDIDHLEVNTDVDFRIQIPMLNVHGIITVENGNFKTGNSVTLISDENGTGMFGPIEGIVSGNVFAQRFHNAGNDGYMMISSPVRNQTVSDFNDHLITTGFPGSDWPDYPFNNIKTYNESTPGSTNEGFEGV
ncbi:MAG: hypothetical protein AAF193_04115, partial [Bacteroidota bacterium]